MTDLVEHILAAVDGDLDKTVATWDERVALGVVMAAEGYPGSYSKGHAITGLTDAEDENTKVFHAGTSTDTEQAEIIKASGGRVLCVSSLGNTVRDAQNSAYAAASRISWQGSWYRTDIGHRAVDR